MMKFHSQVFLESLSNFHGSSHHQPGDDCLPITIAFLAMASMASMAFMAMLETVKPPGYFHGQSKNRLRQTENTTSGWLQLWPFIS